MSRLSRPSASRRVNIGAAILEQPVIEMILKYLRLQAQLPPRVLAREPRGSTARRGAARGIDEQARQHKPGTAAHLLMTAAGATVAA